MGSELDFGWYFERAHNVFFKKTTCAAISKLVRCCQKVTPNGTVSSANSLTEDEQKQKEKRRRQRYPLLGSSDDDAAGQSAFKHIIRLEVSGCSREGREAGQTQLEARRWRFWGRGRRLRCHPLRCITEKQSELGVVAVPLMGFRPTSIMTLRDNTGKVGTHCKLFFPLFPKNRNETDKQRSKTTSVSIQN